MMSVKLSECSYCSTPVLKQTEEDKTILDCSFCGKVVLVEKEWQAFRLKRKQRGLRKIGNRSGHRRQEVECEGSCVTIAENLADETDLSDSGSTASSQVVDIPIYSSKSYALLEASAAHEADGTVSTKSAKKE